MKPKYKRVCPYCGETCEGYVGNSLICKCGAKYYFTTQTWLERKKPKEKNTPDLVEVVRCKDCKHRYVPCRCALWYGMADGKEYFLERGEDFYCPWGERSEE